MEIKVFQYVNKEKERVEYLIDDDGKDKIFESVSAAASFLIELGVDEAEMGKSYVETEEGERILFSDALTTEVLKVDTRSDLDLADLSVDDLKALQKAWITEGFKLYDDLRRVGMVLGKKAQMSGDPHGTEYWYWIEGPVVLNVFRVPQNYSVQAKDYEVSVAVNVYVGTEVQSLSSPWRETEPIRVAEHQVCALSRIYGMKSGDVLRERDPRWTGQFVPGQWLEFMADAIEEAKKMEKGSKETQEQKEKKVLLVSMLYKEDI